MATAIDESALQAEIQKLDAEGREAERRLRDLENREKNAGYVGCHLVNSNTIRQTFISKLFYYNLNIHF